MAKGPYFSCDGLQLSEGDSCVGGKAAVKGREKEAVPDFPSLRGSATCLSWQRLLLAQCLAHGLRMQLGGFLRVNKLSETGSKFIKISSETNLLSGLLNSVRWRARGRARTWEMPGLLGRRFGTIYWIIVGVSINSRVRGPQFVSSFPESTVHIILARVLSGKQLSEDLLASGSLHRRGLGSLDFTVIPSGNPPL